MREKNRFYGESLGLKYLQGTISAQTKVCFLAHLPKLQPISTSYFLNSTLRYLHILHETMLITPKIKLTDIFHHGFAQFFKVFANIFVFKDLV